MIDWFDVSAAGRPDRRSGAHRFFLLAALLLCVASMDSARLVQAAGELTPTPMPVDPSQRGGEGRLVVCADPNAMPRTGRAEDGSSRGIDLAIAEIVCRQMGRKLEVRWCAAGNCHWNDLQEKFCDIALGQPLGSGPEAAVAWSTAYCGCRFGLVVPRQQHSVHSLADLHGRRVGIVAGTVPISSKEHTVVPFSNRQALLSQMVSRDLDAAFVDGDYAAWYLHAHPDLPLRLLPEFAAQQRWNMAFAVRKEDRELLASLNLAIKQSISNGQVAKASAEYGIPYRQPFEEDRSVASAQDSWPRIHERGSITVSMDPANLPYSSAQEGLPGLDVEIARILATELGMTLQLEWIDIHRETAVGALLDGDCDLALGVPIEPNAMDDEVSLAGKLIYSQPYYGTGYLLVGRENGPHVRSLSELQGRKSRRLGTEAGSVADYHLRQKGYHRQLFRTQLSVLKSVHDGGIDYGYLWANVGWVLHNSPDLDVRIVPDYLPEDHWNVAIAMRRGDAQLKRHVDAAIEKLVRRGEVARVMGRYHVPHFSPFVTKLPLEGRPTKAESAPSDGGAGRPSLSARAGARTEVPRRSGLQDSQPKASYSALEQIQAKTTLTVGLDQKNLPFSTAHGEPAGLDYEIAGLLAQQLGVSRTIYWAYSSHDSYPSKLAKKKLCDVVLGVMPDDRFANRVAYTQPYYYASYQYVVHADAANQAELLPSATLAIEPGLVVQGIEGRTTQQYRSLDDILAAVAGKQIGAGYVIGTRGNWLAAKQWPDELRFLNAPSPVDRFPICAAVRKSDDDLRIALDHAFGALAASGKLEKVFRHWHIPYDSTARETTSTAVSGASE